MEHAGEKYGFQIVHHEHLLLPQPPSPPSCPLPPSFPIFSGPFLSACSSSIQGLVPKRSIHNCRRGKDLGDNFLAGLSRSRGMDDCSGILFPHFSEWNLCRASAHRKLAALASRSDLLASLPRVGVLLPPNGSCAEVKGVS